MILQFDDRVVGDLTFLAELSEEQLIDFCKLTVDATISGAEPQTLTRAASSIGVDKETVSKGAAALSSVFIEASKNRLAKDKFLLSVADFAIPDDHKTMLAEFYGEHRKGIRESLAHLKMTFPAYRKLDWRLDIELASRSLHTTAAPSFVLRLDTTNPDVSSTYMQADYANLKRLVEALEAAEAELDNSHSKRVVKFIR